MSSPDQHAALAADAGASAQARHIAAIALTVQSELGSPTTQRGRVIEEAGSALRALPTDCLDPKRIETLLEVGQLAYFEGRSSDGLAIVKAGFDLAARAGLVPLQRKALTYEAVLHGDLGDLPTAVESTAGAIVLVRSLADPRAEAALWGNLSEMLSTLGDWRSALPAAERALELRSDDGSASVTAAECCLELGQTAKGLRYARAAVEREGGAESLQDLTVRAEAAAMAGRLYLEVDDVARALELARLARSYAEKAATPRAMPTVLALEGMCALLAGERKRGVRLLNEAQDGGDALRSVDQYRRRAMRWTSRALAMVGQSAEARDLLNDQAELFLEASRRQLATAASLSGSSAFPLVSDLHARPYSRSGSVYERFAAIASMLEEPSGEHGFRVGDLAAMLARDCGCDDEDVAAAAQAGRLHDLGLLCVPASVAGKDDPLDAVEEELYRLHPVHGASLLDAAGLSKSVLDGVRHHHERWDGKGYPFRLAGDAIPFTARIVGIAEAFDDMTHASVRAREPWTVRRALEELLRQRGARFEPRLVDLLIERVRRTQREPGGLDEASSATADRSTLAIARRRLREMLQQPVEAGTHE